MYRNKSGNRKNFSKLNNAGFTLMELIITIAILGIVGGVIVVFLQTSTKSYESTDKEVNIQYDAQVILNQIGSYILDADEGFYQTDNTVYIYSNGESALDIEILSWDAEKQELYYEKKQQRNYNQETVVEKTTLAQNVSDFSMDFSKVEKEQKVDARLELQNNDKNFSATATWNLRNKIFVDADIEDDYVEEVEAESTVTEVQVTSSRNVLVPGEEQLFVAKVIGSAYPSQSVAWSIEGEKASNDTYIGLDGILHVGEDETVSELLIVAQSVQNPNVTGKRTVQINQGGIRILPDEVWLGVPRALQDPDGFSRSQVELSAEIIEDEIELSDLVWTSDITKYQKSMEEQADNTKKTIKLSYTGNTKSDTGDMWVQAAATDSDGNIIMSNQSVIHRVLLWPDRNYIVHSETYAVTFYIYGMEDVPEGDLKIATSFDDIKHNLGNCRFYIYDSKEMLNYYDFAKRSDGSWRCRLYFDADFTIWEKLFPTESSRYTYIGIYEAGELNPTKDSDGNVYNYGFSLLKMELRPK